MIRSKEQDVPSSLQEAIEQLGLRCRQRTLDEYPNREIYLPEAGRRLEIVLTFFESNWGWIILDKDPTNGIRELFFFKDPSDRRNSEELFNRRISIQESKLWRDPFDFWRRWLHERGLVQCFPGGVYRSRLQDESGQVTMIKAGTEIMLSWRAFTWEDIELCNRFIASLEGEHSIPSQPEQELREVYDTCYGLIRTTGTWSILEEISHERQVRGLLGELSETSLEDVIQKKVPYEASLILAEEPPSVYQRQTFCQRIRVIARCGCDDEYRPDRFGFHIMGVWYSQGRPPWKEITSDGYSPYNDSPSDLGRVINEAMNLSPRSSERRQRINNLDSDGGGCSG